MVLQWTACVKATRAASNSCMIHKTAFFPVCLNLVFLCIFLQMAWLAGIWARRSAATTWPIPAASRNQLALATKPSPTWESFPSTPSTRETGTQRAWSTSWAPGSWAWPSHPQHPRHLPPQSPPATSPALSAAPWRRTRRTWSTSTRPHRPTLDAGRCIKTRPRSSPPPPVRSPILRHPTPRQSQARTPGCSQSSRTTPAFSSRRARGTCSRCPTANHSRARWTRSESRLRWPPWTLSGTSHWGDQCLTGPGYPQPTARKTYPSGPSCARGNTPTDPARPPCTSGPTPARRRAATGASPDPTSSPDTSASTLATNPSSVGYAWGTLVAATTWRPTSARTPARSRSPATFAGESSRGATKERDTPKSTCDRRRGNHPRRPPECPARSAASPRASARPVQASRLSAGPCHIQHYVGNMKTIIMHHSWYIISEWTDESEIKPQVPNDIWTLLWCALLKVVRCSFSFCLSRMLTDQTHFVWIF